MAAIRKPEVEIDPLASDGEAEVCARIMASTDPWVTLGQEYDHCLRVVRDPEAEVYVARADDEVIGFIIVVMRGAFRGYIQTLAVRDDWRSDGIGSRLIAFAEERIFRDSANVFICVSSFNPRARALYLRLGYEPVGELEDYFVRGHSEWLMRKSIAPLKDFKPR